MIKNLYLKLFCDKNGKLVLFQFPNLPLFLWIVSSIVSSLTTGALNKVAMYVALASLVTWAVLEILSGSTLFRRTLGVIVLVFTLWGRFR